MADNGRDADVNLIIGTSTDKKEVDKSLNVIDNTVKKHFKDGYIEVPVKVSKFKYDKKYPKTDYDKKVGLGTDYSRLQKAQDKLLKDYKKLSKGFSSSEDEDIVNALFSHRKYEKTVRSHYNGVTSKKKDYEDPQVMNIRESIGRALYKNFIRLIPELAKKSNELTDEKYIEYAREAVKRYKAAKEADVDLTKDVLTKEDKNAITKAAKNLETKFNAEKSIEDKKRAQKKAKETAKAEKKELNKIEKERETQNKKAVSIPKYSTKDPEFTSTEVENLAAPRKDTRTEKEKERDRRIDKRIIKGFSLRYK